MKLRNRTHRQMHGISDSPRGCMTNHKNVEFLETKMISRDQIHSPIKEHRKNNIMRDAKIPNEKSPRMIEFMKRMGVHFKLYGEPLDGQDGRNCFGFPYVNLGEVEERVSDSVENGSPSTMSFDQMVEMNSARMITPNGQEFPYGVGLTDDFIEKMSKKPSVVNNPILIYFRGITNSQVIPLTEELGFTDDIWNEPELMEEFITWCVRLQFNLDENFFLYIDCPVDTYTKVLLEPDSLVVN